MVATDWCISVYLNKVMPVFYFIMRQFQYEACVIQYEFDFLARKSKNAVVVPSVG